MNEIIKKNGTTFGLVLGLISIIITTIVYAVNIELFTKWWLGIITISISIGMGIYIVSKTKKEMKGQISFKECFSVYFVAAAIGSALSMLYNYILFNFIDPQAKETIKEITMKYTSEMLQKFDTPAETIKETMAKIAETDNYSIENILSGLAVSLLFSAIFALILAAFFKTRSSQGL